MKAATVFLIQLSATIEGRRNRGTFPLSRIKALKHPFGLSVTLQPTTALPATAQTRTSRQSAGFAVQKVGLGNIHPAFHTFVGF
jgi:hypothetical protein